MVKTEIFVPVWCYNYQFISFVTEKKCIHWNITDTFKDLFDKWADTLSSDILAPFAAKSLAAIVLAMCDEHVRVHEIGFEIPVVH